MEPLSTIELSRCKWLGVLAIAGTIIGEVLILADYLNGRRTSLVGREVLRQATRHQQRS